jgi:hypothetical protein
MAKAARVLRGSFAGTDGRMKFKWETATAGEIVILYEAIRDLLKPKALTWKQVFAEASPGIQIGTDYERNFRRGRIAPKRAKEIFDWLARRFPETADYVDELLSSVHKAINSDAPWERFIEENGSYSNVALHVVRIEERAHRKPASTGSKITLEQARRIEAQYELKLHTRFTFKIDSPLRGVLCVLQWSRGVWWPIPLGRFACWTDVQEGPQWLPYDPEKNEGDLPHLLTEHTETGLHRLVFLFGRTVPQLLKDADPEQRLDPDHLDQLADACRSDPIGSWQLCCLNVLFKALDTP